MAGLGTVGMEIITQLPEADAVIVPVGSGGLLASVLIACTKLKCSCLVYVRYTYTYSILNIYLWLIMVTMIVIIGLIYRNIHTKKWLICLVPTSVEWKPTVKLSPNSFDLFWKRFFFIFYLRKLRCMDELRWMDECQNCWTDLAEIWHT